MDLKKILLGIFAILWTIGVIAQQIYWISNGGYNIIAATWTLIELSLPYLLFNAIKED